MLAVLAAKSDPSVTAFTLTPELKGIKREIQNLPIFVRCMALSTTSYPLTALLRSVQDQILIYDEPFYSLSPSYLIYKAIKQAGFKVALNGLGGDELFAGYTYYSFMKPARTLAKLLPFKESIRKLSYMNHITDRAFGAASSKSGFEFGTNIRLIFTDNEKRHLFPEFASSSTTFELQKDRFEISKLENENNWVKQLSFIELKNYIPNHHLLRTDAFSMRFGVEARVPFLDHRFVEFAFNLPTKYKLSGVQRKILLKAIGSKSLPPSLKNAPKMGFDLPMERWMKGP